MEPDNKAGEQSLQGEELSNSGRLSRLAHTGEPPPKLPKEKKPHFDCTVLRPTSKKVPSRDLPPEQEEVDPSNGDAQVEDPAAPPPASPQS